MGSVEKFFLNGRDPFHGLGWTGWKDQKTLAQGGQGSRSSAKGAGGRAGNLTCDLIITLVTKTTGNFYRLQYFGILSTQKLFNYLRSYLFDRYLLM